MGKGPEGYLFRRILYRRRLVLLLIFVTLEISLADSLVTTLKCWT